MKLSEPDYSTGWIDPPSGGGSGIEGPLDENRILVSTGGGGYVWAQGFNAVLAGIPYRVLFDPQGVVAQRYSSEDDLQTGQLPAAEFGFGPNGGFSLVRDDTQTPPQFAPAFPENAAALTTRAYVDAVASNLQIETIALIVALG